MNGSLERIPASRRDWFWVNYRIFDSTENYIKRIMLERTKKIFRKYIRRKS